MTSAVLDRVEWEPAPKSDKEPAIGKNQIIAMNTLKHLASSGQVTIEAWREACIGEGIIRQRFNEAKKSLVASGMVEINNLLVTVRERTNGHPLLYKGCVRSVHSVRERTANEIGNSSVPSVSDISDASNEEIDF
jgi:hypothetical protein